MTVDELVVNLTLGTEQFDKGLKSAEKDVSKFANSVVGLSKGVTATDIFFNDRKGARDFSWIVAELAKSITYMGKPIEGSVSSVKSLGDMLELAKEKANGLFIVFRGLFASTMFLGAVAWVGKFVSSFKDMKKEATELFELNKRLKDDVGEISAWGNAVEFDGGSAKSFQRTLASIKGDMVAISTGARSRVKPIYEELGLDTDKFQGKKVTDVVKEITAAVEKMDKAKSSDLLRRLGFDADSIAVIQKGTKNVEAMIRQQKEWGVYTKKDTDAIDKLDKSLKQMNLVLKSTFLPLFTRVIGTAAKFATYLAKASIWLRNHLDVLKKAVYVLAVAFSQKLAKALMELGILAMNNPFVLFIISISALLLLLEDLWVYANKGKSAFSGWWKKLGDPDKVLKGFEKFFEIVSSIGEFMDSKLGRAIGLFLFILKIGLMLVSFFTIGIPAAVVAAIAAIIAFATIYRKKIAEVFNNVWSAVKEFASGIIESVESAFTTAKDTIVGIWEGLVDSFNRGCSAISDFLSSAANTAKEAWAGFIGWLEKKWQWIKDMLPSLESITNKLPSISGGMKTAIAGAGGSTSTTYDNSQKHYNVTLTNDVSAEKFINSSGYKSQGNSGVNT